MDLVLRGILFNYLYVIYASTNLDRVDHYSGLAYNPYIQLRYLQFKQ